MENGTPKPGIVELRITLDQLSGQIQVTGPVNNSVLAYGMIEAAKDAIRRFNEKAASDSRIVTMPMNLTSKH